MKVSETWYAGMLSALRLLHHCSHGETADLGITLHESIRNMICRDGVNPQRLSQHYSQWNWITLNTSPVAVYTFQNILVVFFP